MANQLKLLVVHPGKLIKLYAPPRAILYMFFSHEKCLVLRIYLISDEDLFPNGMIAIFY